MCSKIVVIRVTALTCTEKHSLKYSMSVKADRMFVANFYNSALPT